MKQTDIKRLEDKFDHAISLASQSMPAAISPIMFEMRNKIDTLAKSLQAIQEKQELHMATHTVTDKNTSDGLLELQETSKETLEQVKKTNGRVTVLEQWRENTINFTKGLKAGGRGTYIAIATVIGVAWIVFGDFIKKKVGL